MTNRPPGYDLLAELNHNKLWGEIHRMAKNDAALRDLLDRVILYYLLKKDKNGIS